MNATQEIVDMEQGANNALAVAKGFTIVTSEDYSEVDHHCANLAMLEAEIKKQFAEPKQKAFEAHRSITALESRLLAPIADARRLDKAKLGDWKTAQRAAAEAERRRLEDEAMRKAEGEAAMLLMQAEESGNEAAIEEVMSAPVVIAPVFVQADIPKSRTTIRTVTKFRIVNAALIPADFLMPDESKIGKYGRAMGKDAKVAGVEFYQESV